MKTFLAMCRVRLEEDPMCLEELPELCKNNEELVVFAASRNPLAFQFASNERKRSMTTLTRITFSLQKDQARDGKKLFDYFETEKAACNSDDEELAEINKLCYSNLCSDPMQLQNMSEEHRNNEDVVVCAASRNPEAFQFASEERKQSESTVLKILSSLQKDQYKHTEKLFLHMHDDLKENMHVLQEVMRVDGLLPFHFSTRTLKTHKGLQMYAYSFRNIVYCFNPVSALDLMEDEESVLRQAMRSTPCAKLKYNVILLILHEFKMRDTSHSLITMLPIELLKMLVQRLFTFQW